MRMRRRLAGAAGMSAILLLAVGCAGSAQKKVSPGASAAVAAAKPLPMKAAPHPATWTGTDDKVHPLRITPTRLARGAESDLVHIRLDDDLKGMVPYYLTFSYTNTGKSAVSGVDPARNFSINGADGRPAEQISLFQSNPMATGSGLPAACRESGAEKLAAGATTTVCQIFMLGKDQQPATVSYKDAESETLLWQVGGGKGGGATGILPAGKSADSATEDSDKHPVPLYITPKGVRAGKIADLSRFDLDADEKKLIPYYVTMQYKNTGKHDVLPSMNDGVVLRTAAGQESRKMVLIDIGGPGVSQCPEATPDDMVKPGATVTECSIHMLAKGEPPVAVVFQGHGESGQPVTWRVETDGAK